MDGVCKLIYCVIICFAHRFNYGTNGQQDRKFVHSPRSVDGKTLNFQKTIAEDTRGVIFQLSNSFQEGQIFTLISSTVDLFSVDRMSGSVFLRPAKRLNYEDSAQRSIQLKVNATDIHTKDTTQIILTITVTDINDAAPEFQNRPYPYLATVGINTPANHKVFELFAVDPDTTATVTYRIDSGSDGRFYISTESVYVRTLGATVQTGAIYTQGEDQFEEGREYALLCVAVDSNAQPPQTAFATVYVKVGFRPPQFYENPLRGTVRENNGIDQTLNNEFRVEVIGFQGHTVMYSLRDMINATSSQFYIEMNGTIKTKEVLDYESVPKEQRPPIYKLNVIATETVTNLQSTAKVFIEVLDDNDNSPVFGLSRYSASHPEDLPIGAAVMEVMAVDDDSGTNAELVYSVDHENFDVQTVNRSSPRGTEYVGIIVVKKRLDYDRLPGHLYSFTVTATDKGTPAASGTANVRVFMTNVNDEPPIINLEDQKLDVRENAQVGRVVTVIQASDLDKDQVKLYFSPQLTRYEIFEIIPTSGLIRLAQTVPAHRDDYVLHITAVDDGSCCGGLVQLSSEAYLNVEIVDINTHTPSFPNCAGYNNATILENEPTSSLVIWVQAVDEDRGENGKVTYSILKSTIQIQDYFYINDTGHITSAMEFDRESQSTYSITVRGTDRGVPQLDGYCTFKVSIGDVNDNAPKFDLPAYTATISESYETGRSVITVRADDADLGINAEITYVMIDSSGGYFRIEQDAGIIFLNKTLESQRETYNVRVMAKDKGNPSKNTTVSVTVRVTDLSSQPPTWNRNDYDQNPYPIDETAAVGHVIASFAAKSNVDDPDVSYFLIDSDGNTVQSVPPFGISWADNTVNLTVFTTMDFNVKNRYELRLRVTNQGGIILSSEIHPVVELRDTNNDIPYFRGLDTSTGYYPGSIPENAPPGQTVIEIKAYDDDPTSPNNLLSFEIIPKENVSDKFSIRKIDDNTAVLTSTAMFDREEDKQLFLNVKVSDGTESSRPNHPPGQPNTAIAKVQIRITDMNDNPPYFPSPYNASVREDASVQQSILTVSASDPDDAAVLTYSITAGNVRGAFVIQAKTGMIFVGRQLDYETEQHVYNLRINVSDGIYNSITTAEIHVLDANDNSPVFAEDPYIITDVVEEDTSITPANKRLLATVSATDADVDRPTNIRFSLLGFGTTAPNKYFEIEADTGRLYLLTSLDRDLPSGRPNYQFNIRAQDEPDPPPGSTDLDRPQFGYTSVQVKPIDINDNAPIFISNLEGSVPEHSPRGSSVLAVVAIDYDEGLNGAVKYEIVEGPSHNAEMKFSILENTGLIETSTDESGFDREITPTYKVVVKASDRGNTSRSTDAVVTINLDDINDQIPVFEKEIYKIIMSEAQPSGAIARVKATDNDIGENGRLDYSLSNHLDHFAIELENNEGNIVVYRAVDYEDVNQRFFNLTVIVQDPDPSHTATAHVEVSVEDFNDNAPIFVTPRMEVQKYENAPVGTFLAHLSASDADRGINAIFIYSVDPKSDPDRLFSIDDNGNVTIKKMMDREKQDHHEVFILAIDRGDPAQTGTATLVVTVLDVNDNFPIFAKDYRPIVMENADVVPESVIVVSAVDLDNDPFGPPFGFSETKCSDGSDTCPCDGRPTCNDFSLEFIPGGDIGKGNAKLSTKRVFDREKQKFYHMPIVMWDMRDKGDPRAMTGTNTLTIQIGDVNDHVHKPGHQDVFVYNYKGMFDSIEIGTVYANDPDDWDVVDKTFTYTGPHNLAKYFSVDKDSGKITMAKGVPGNKAHTFTVDVYDRVWDVTVECTVTVTIQDISEEAVFSSGAVRLKGISAEEFVKRPMSSSHTGVYGASKNEKFRTYIASKVNIQVDNVRIVGVHGNNDITDVYFSIQDSNYYSRSSANAFVAVHKKSIEAVIGVRIDQAPLSMCTGEHKVGCYNSLLVTGKPNLVNTNGTSFVGVDISLIAMEECRSGSFPPSDNCSVEYCYNGGTCNMNDWGDVICECLPGFDGPRCQATHHSFDGNSYALYEPLEQCENSRTSLYIITTELDGLILYNGPTDGPDTDFISLELSSGYPRLRINHGSGVLELYVDGRNEHGIVKMQRLNDGTWHRIDIVRHGRSVDLIVDHCDGADIGFDSTVKDDKMCHAFGTMPGKNMKFNVNTMLQLGGRFHAPGDPSGNTRFDGCIKNLMHNSKLYDLTVPDNTSYSSGANRCTREDVICGENSQGGPVCGDNGICESTWQPDTTTCICKPGYMGHKCSDDTTTKDLKKNSFIQWRLKDSFFNSASARKLKMNMMFRTRDTDGVLWTVSSTKLNVGIILQILSGRLTLTYNLGDGIRNLELYNRFVSNGAWHATVVERNGGAFILKMDNGEGPNYNNTYGYPLDKQEMLIENTLYAGARVSFEETRPVLKSDLVNTCVRDIRMDNEWFPMEASDNSKSNGATLSKASNVDNGCFRVDCGTGFCPRYMNCYPLWDSYECRCVEHYEKDSNGICVELNYCNSHSCLNGSTCETNLGSPHNYTCLCPPGWAGQFCEHQVQLRFEKSVYNVIMSEAQASGVIATVWVTGNHSKITYRLENHLDHFRVKEGIHTAFVQVVRPVDYEKVSERFFTLIVVAEDNITVSGYPAVLTGSTQVLVTVQDVNDNYPVFAQNYRPVVMENNLNFPALITSLNARDADSPMFGAPFGFRCANFSSCMNFGMSFHPDGDGGRGQAQVETHRVFDREQQKFYYLPVLMWDMRGSGDPRAMTGTNTLTIEIGDVNDNKHSPGYKDILVYSYGLTFPLEIGNVYATDLDDWDVVDKTFTYAGPKHMENYFSIDYNSGKITMTRPLPGKQTLTFTVDVRDNFWKMTVQSLVSVTLRDFGVPDISSAVPTRLIDITAEEFIWRDKANGNLTVYKRSKYDMFKKALANKLSISEDEVNIFSLQHNETDTAVWISVEGQGHQGLHLLNTTLLQNHTQIGSQAGVTIMPISTWNATITGQALLVNTNATSLVGIQMTSLP